jgi:nucleoid-associated protein YgaU
VERLRLLVLPLVVVVLERCAPPGRCLQALQAAGARTAGTTDATAPLVGAVGLLAWACTAYLVLLAALTLGARLPGPAGRALAAVLRRAAPLVLRRGLALALGLAVVAGPLAAGSPASADDGGPGRAATATAETGAPGTAGLDWPVAPAAAPAAPPAASRVAPPTQVAPPGTPRLPAAAHATRVRATPPTTTAGRRATTARPATSVVVRPGDTLWGLAARQLGPDAPARRVAVAWPQWWVANREVVGPDPDLLHPGTRLVVPPAAAPGASSTPTTTPTQGAER